MVVSKSFLYTSVQSSQNFQIGFPRPLSSYCIPSNGLPKVDMVCRLMLIENNSLMSHSSTGLMQSYRENQICRQEGLKEEQTNGSAMIFVPNQCKVSAINLFTTTCPFTKQPVMLKQVGQIRGKNLSTFLCLRCCLGQNNFDRHTKS